MADFLLLISPLLLAFINLVTCACFAVRSADSRSFVVRVSLGIVASLAIPSAILVCFGQFLVLFASPMDAHFFCAVWAYTSYVGAGVANVGFLLALIEHAHVSRNHKKSSEGNQRSSRALNRVE
jgi:hypothetical protein